MAESCALQSVEMQMFQVQCRAVLVQSVDIDHTLQIIACQVVIINSCGVRSICIIYFLKYLPTTGRLFNGKSFFTR